ncbi:MAG TPA: hypothetical protein VH539_08005, partial [Gemmatimonadaceae bacterium]
MTVYSTRCIERSAKVLPLLALPLVVLVPRSSAAQGRPAALDRFLTQTVGLTAGDVDKLSRGETITKILPT